MASGNFRSPLVARGALAAALCLVLLSLSALIPTLDLALAAIGAFVIYIVLIEFGAPIAWLVFLVSAVLGLLLLPQKSAVLFFTLFFGWYPMFRTWLVRFPIGLSWLCKFACVATVFGVSFFVAKRFFLLALEITPMLLICGIGLGVVAFTAYEIGLSRLLIFYRQTLRSKLFRK